MEGEINQTRPRVRLLIRNVIALLSIPLLCVAVVAVFLRPIHVKVLLMDGQIQVQPDTIRDRKQSLRFTAENVGSETHQFIVIITNKPSGQLPVENGVAQFFMERDQRTNIIYDGFDSGGYELFGPQENPTLGPPLQPGETRAIPYGYPRTAHGEQTITILCNLPGHYEQGEYATFKIIE